MRRGRYGGECRCLGKRMLAGWEKRGEYRVGVLSKLPVFLPISSRSTPSQRRTAASRATFFLRRRSSIPFIGFSRSCLVRTLPPMTLRNSPLMAPRLEPTTPVGLEVSVCCSFCLALWRIEWTSSSRSFRMYWPLLVLRPEAAISTGSTPAEDTGLESASLVAE